MIGFVVEVAVFKPNWFDWIVYLDSDTSRDFFQLNPSLDLAEAQALEKRTVLQGESKEWLVRHECDDVLLSAS